MNNGKVLILGTILKLDKPFRPPEIIEATGLSRQLVHHHLTRLCETGGLEKIKLTYVVRDKEVLLEDLLNTTDEIGTKKPEPGGFFSADRTKMWTTHAELIVAARTLDLGYSLAAREGMLKKIDDSIKVLKQLRKYLTHSTKTVGSAQKFFNKMGWSDPAVVRRIWEIFGFYYPDLELQDFEEDFIEAMSWKMKADEKEITTNSLGSTTSAI
jgi:hypothetical protein